MKTVFANGLRSKLNYVLKAKKNEMKLCYQIPVERSHFGLPDEGES